ncbi:hypothetical protein GF312_11800 [Candidatus Poribacteria bacterium]|nr:hypothetical protein [Candidatus Poribacteria bacterium]
MAQGKQLENSIEERISVREDSPFNDTILDIIMNSHKAIPDVVIRTAELIAYGYRIKADFIGGVGLNTF